MKSEDYVLDVSSFIFPVRKREIFRREKPLILEIGFGEGEFLINTARSDIERNYLGIEIKAGRFRKAVRDAARLPLNNIKFVHIEASIALRQVFEKNIFDSIVINFPDPWPKKKHSKHRVFNSEFIDCMANALAAGGRAAIKTDRIEYIEQIACEFEKSGLFRSLYPPPRFVEADRGELETKFEKQFRKDSQKIFSAVFLNSSVRKI